MIDGKGKFINQIIELVGFQSDIKNSTL